MNKFNPVKFAKLIKEKIKTEIKSTFFSKIILFGFASYSIFTIVKYKLYSFSEFCFDLSEEKKIAKKIFPLIKYKYIESFYDEENEEVKFLNLLYQNLIKIFRLNLKSEIFLVKSDLCFLYTLPTGSLFISDINLLDQFHKAINNGIGFEHYFLNYYLYLPFSKTQEQTTIFEAIKYLCDLEILDINKTENDNLNNFFKELVDVLNTMKAYSNKEVKEIKKELNKENYICNFETEKVNKISYIRKEIGKFIKRSKENISDKDDINDINTKSKKDEISKNIIYGDYKYKNEFVEVYIHQRTMKKVRYKKREYSEIHSIDAEKMEAIKQKLNDYLDNKIQIDYDFTFDLKRANKENLKQILKKYNTNL